MQAKVKYLYLILFIDCHANANAFALNDSIIDFMLFLWIATNLTSQILAMTISLLFCAVFLSLRASEVNVAKQALRSFFSNPYAESSLRANKVSAAIYTKK